MGMEETKKRALRMLEKRDYARGELVDKLVRKGEPVENAEAVADRMVELGVINDANFAGMVVRHYAAKGYGRARITEELRRRKIGRDLWDAAFEELPEQADALDRLLRSKLRGAAPEGDALRKATDALRRRGFSWEQINAVVERLRSEAADET